MSINKGRIFAGFGAALFLVTSSALAIAVIWATASPKSQGAAILNPSSNANATLPTGPVGSILPGFVPITKPLTHLEEGDLTTGTGTSVRAGATVKVNYVGVLANNGRIFDTSAAHGGPVSFSLSGVIPGWRLGIPGMKVGGIRLLLIPAAMGYGSSATGSIPANSDLAFYVQLVGIVHN